MYDVTGREVANLVSGHWEAGFHHARWDAAIRQASGVYFARFTARDNTGKMRLTKTTKVLLVK